MFQVIPRGLRIPVGSPDPLPLRIACSTAMAICRPISFCDVGLERVDGHGLGSGQISTSLMSS